MQVIQAADKALSDKDAAIEAGNVALSTATDQLTDCNKKTAEQDKQLSSVGRNPFVLIGVGTAGGALLAANIIAPGIGVLVVAAVLVIFKL